MTHDHCLRKEVRAEIMLCICYNLPGNVFVLRYMYMGDFVMNRWFYFNILLLIIAVWKLAVKNFFEHFQVHILIGFIGLLFILFNWTRHAVFSTIRTTPDRQRKIKFANLSKKVVHIHKWTGSTALIIIILHAIFTWQHFGFYFKNIKVLSGLVTVLVLAAVVTTGWMRRYRPTLRKRYFHLFLGMSMFFLIVIHILL